MAINTTRGTSPGMMLYASDLMAKREYRLMSFAERGLFFSMLCECWANTELPVDPAELSAFLGKDVSQAMTNRVSDFFHVTERNTFVSLDLEAYRAEVLSRRSRMSDGGKKSAEARKNTKHPDKVPDKHLSKGLAKDDAKNPDKVHSDFAASTLQGRESESESESESENLPIQGGNFLGSNKEVA